MPGIYNWQELRDGKNTSRPRLKIYMRTPFLVHLAQYIELDLFKIWVYDSNIKFANILACNRRIRHFKIY